MTLNGERVERNGWSSIKFDTGGEEKGRGEGEESNLFSSKFHASKIEELKFRRNDLPPLVLPHYASIFTDAKIYTIIPRREKSRGFRWMENCNGPSNVAHWIESKLAERNKTMKRVLWILSISSFQIEELENFNWFSNIKNIENLYYSINKVFEMLVVYRLIMIECNQF